MTPKDKALPQSPSPSTPPSGLLAWVAAHELFFFWLLAATLLLPVWLPSIFVTLDGPAHLAVAALWPKIGDPRWPELAEFLNVDLRPVPNLTSYILLRGFLALTSPLLAEKLLLSVYLALFALAVRYFTKVMGQNAKIFSFLFLLLIYNFAVEYGFYNFILGLPLYLIGVSFWLSRRQTGSLFSFLGYGLISLACYFTHLSALAMLILTIALIELQAFHRAWRNSGIGFLGYLRGHSRSWRQRWQPLVAAHIPALLLSLHFLFFGSAQFTSAAGNFSSRDEITTLLRIGKLGAGASFATLDRFTLIFSGAIVIIGILSYAVLLGRMDRNSRLGNPFTFGLLGVLALYLFLPDHLVTHWISTRLMVFLFMLYVMWLAAIPYRAEKMAAPWYSYP